MEKTFRLLVFAMLGMCTQAMAAEPEATKRQSDLTEATFLITGLHCPPCTTTIERSLSKEKGLQSISVDWKTKKARAAFDESKLSAQEVANLIAKTPHMMGKKLHYAGSLALKVEELHDKASGDKVTELLTTLQGVKRVVPYPKERVVSVEFSNKGRVTDRELIETLSRAGFHVKNL